MRESSACDEDEDAVSMALTVVRRLVEANGVDYGRVGMLQVGSESLLDRSKSIKSHLMSLFGEHTNVEGTDCYHACYGGTAAVISCVNWVESTAYDGRWAIAVCTDISDAPDQYAFMNGAAAVAMLIGRDAPLAFEGTRVSHMADEWDFYKPVGWKSMAPLMDGPGSKEVYFQALARCQSRFAQANGDLSFVDDHDALVFHLGGGYKFVWHAFEHAMRVAHGDNVDDGEVRRRFDVLVEPSLRAAVRIGPCHTAATYVNLCSLLVSQPPDVGSKIGVFSFGSGAACTMFTLRVRGAIRLDPQWMASLERRRPLTPSQFSKVCARYAQSYGRFDYVPSAPTAPPARSYCIDKVTALGRRVYRYAEYEEISFGDDDGEDDDDTDNRSAPNDGARTRNEANKRADEACCYQSSGMRAERDADRGVIRNVVHQLLPGLADDASMLEAGLDSLGAAELRARVGAELRSKDIGETLVFDHPTLRALQDHLVPCAPEVPAAAVARAAPCRPCHVDVAAEVRRLVPGIDADASLSACGIDSLGAAEIRARLSGALQCSLPDTLVFDHPTIRELERCAESRAPSECATPSKDVAGQAEDCARRRAAEAPPQVAQIVRDLLPNIEDDADILGAGLDSLGAAELRARLASALDVELPETFVFDFPSIRSMQAHLASPPPRRPTPDPPRQQVVDHVPAPSATLQSASRPRLAFSASCPARRPCDVPSATSRLAPPANAAHACGGAVSARRAMAWADDNERECLRHIASLRDGKAVVIIGAGLSALALVQEMLERGEMRQLVVVDRNAGPGGMWRSPYEGLALHGPRKSVTHPATFHLWEGVDVRGLATPDALCAYASRVQRWAEARGVRFLFESSVERDGQHGALRLTRHGRTIAELAPLDAVIDARCSNIKTNFAVPVRGLPSASVRRVLIVGAGKQGVDVGLQWLARGADVTYVSRVPIAFVAREELHSATRGLFPTLRRLAQKHCRRDWVAECEAMVGEGVLHNPWEGEAGNSGVEFHGAIASRAEMEMIARTHFVRGEFCEAEHDDGSHDLVLRCTGAFREAAVRDGINGDDDLPSMRFLYSPVISAKIFCSLGNRIHEHPINYALYPNRFAMMNQLMFELGERVLPNIMEASLAASCVDDADMLRGRESVVEYASVGTCASVVKVPAPTSPHGAPSPSLPPPPPRAAPPAPRCDGEQGLPYFTAWQEAALRVLGVGARLLRWLRAPRDGETLVTRCTNPADVVEIDNESLCQIIAPFHLEFSFANAHDAPDVRTLAHAVLQECPFLGYAWHIERGRVSLRAGSSCACLVAHRGSPPLKHRPWEWPLYGDAASTWAHSARAWWSIAEEVSKPPLRIWRIDHGSSSNLVVQANHAAADGALLTSVLSRAMQMCTERTAAQLEARAHGLGPRRRLHPSRVRRSLARGRQRRDPPVPCRDRARVETHGGVLRARRRRDHALPGGEHAERRASRNATHLDRGPPDAGVARCRDARHGAERRGHAAHQTPPGVA